MRCSWRDNSIEHQSPGSQLQQHIRHNEVLLQASRIFLDASVSSSQPVEQRDPRCLWKYATLAVARPESQRADGDRLRLLQKHKKHPSALPLLEQYHGHSSGSAQTIEEIKDRRSLLQQIENAAG